MTPPIEALFQAIDVTWPAKARQDHAGWSLRDGAGGGKRVSAATAAPGGEIADVIAAQQALGQTPLVMVRPGEADLDARLEAARFQVIDPTVVYVARVEDLVTDIPPVRAFHVDWPCLMIQREMWAEGGIGPARVDVMDRAQGTKIGLLGRINDAPVGTGFVACHNDIAMVHALEVRAAARRQGVAVNMMRAAAIWAQDVGMTWLSLLVTRANGPANALYRGLGMQAVGEYHYRILRPE